MKRLVNLSYFFKDQLDQMFTKNPDTKVEDIISAFTDEFVNVSHIGRMPKDEAESAYEVYGDRVGFMMSNDGLTPEQYYIERYIEEATAKEIVNFYRHEDGLNKTLKELAKYLYNHDVFHFGNILKDVHLVPLSAKYLRGKTARDYMPIHKLYKPRYYGIVSTGRTIRFSSLGKFPAAIQPDRRKNEYIEPLGPGYFVLNPWTILRPV